MTDLAIPKSYFSVIEPLKDEQDTKKAEQKATDAKNSDLGIRLATGNITGNEAHSGQNGQASQNGSKHGALLNKKVKKDIDINVKKLAKKYKKDPASALKAGVLERTYSAQQAAELSKLLTDKEDLEYYFELAKKRNLNNNDIIAGVKKLKESKKSFLGIKWNKVKEKDFASTLDEFKEIRENFDTENLIKTSVSVIKAPEIKEQAVHYVRSSVYSNENVSHAVEYMVENKSKAQEFFNNTTKLESIKTESGKIKYTGDTILHAGTAATEYKDIKETIFKTAQKTDMTDKLLTKSTDNFVKNPLMTKSIDKFLNLQDKDGNDRFKAEDIFAQSEYMVNKNKKTIELYESNTLKMAGYAQMDSNDIVKAVNEITDNPQKSAKVFEAAESGISSKDVVNISTEKIQSGYKPETDSLSSESVTGSSETSTVTFSSKTVSDPVKNNDTQSIKTSGIIEAKKAEQLKTLVEKAGNETDANKIIKTIKSNPKLAAIFRNPNISLSEAVSKFKEFGDNTELLEAYSKNPDFVEKLKRNPNITTNQLARMVALLNSNDSALVLKLIDELGPNKAMSVLSGCTSETQTREVKDIIEKPINGVSKKEQLDKIKQGENLDFKS